MSTPGPLQEQKLKLMDMQAPSINPTTDLSFEPILRALKDGRKVQRKGWNGQGMFLQVQSPDLNSKMTHSYLYMTIPGCEEGERRLPWQPSQVDIFANDWQIVN